MKSPKDILKEKHGEHVTTPPGGRARARQDQFQQERSGGVSTKASGTRSNDPPKRRKP